MSNTVKYELACKPKPELETPLSDIELEKRHLLISTFINILIVIVGIPPYFGTRCYTYGKPFALYVPKCIYQTKDEKALNRTYNNLKIFSSSYFAPLQGQGLRYLQCDAKKGLPSQFKLLVLIQ